MYFLYTYSTQYTQDISCHMSIESIFHKVREQNTQYLYFYFDKISHQKQHSPIIPDIMTALCGIYESDKNI